MCWFFIKTSFKGFLTMSNLILLSLVLPVLPATTFYWSFRGWLTFLKRIVMEILLVTLTKSEKLIDISNNRIQGPPYVRKRCKTLDCESADWRREFFLGSNERYIPKLQNDTNLALSNIGVRWHTSQQKTLNSSLIIFYENWHDEKILIG